MFSREKKDRIVWLVVFINVCALLIVCGLVWYISSVATHGMAQADIALRQSFQEHRTGFTELNRMMVKEPSLYRISRDCGVFSSGIKDNNYVIWDGASLSELSAAQIKRDRVEVYLKLLQACGVNYIEFNKNSNVTKFEVGSSRTLFGPAEEEFIVFAPRGLAYDASSSGLHEFTPNALEPCWYIVRQVPEGERK